ncbi:Glucooligosaccharide oxidase [Saccharata proteae CBS 121410]|uniref:Glucooligosaccharide oxidase n=1 Tax=Saccharata proteae CBS 121410 TaxID=1314787 RepID=A0A9P4LY81_9PEZI|nr:Glucooligosaccharide oxidase [Saccharata proteae CBS 121410]
MGGLTDRSSTSGGLQSCLTNAVGGNHDLVAFPNKFLYQEEDVKPYNLDYEITPAAVTYPESADMVSAIVQCAAQYDVKCQARSGGHSYANYGLGGTDGAVVVDMKHFQQFSMDESTWIATIGAGTLLHNIDTKLHAAGNRAIAHGTSPPIGVGGHATMGGLGPLSRQWGTTTDQVESMTVVLANGTQVNCSKEEHSDVFFAMRGAGASFGIVTEFRFNTHPEPTEMVSYAYNLTFGGPDLLAQTFKDWTAWITQANLTWKLASVCTILEDGMIISGTFFGSQDEFSGLNIEVQLPNLPPVELTLHDSYLGMLAHDAEELGLVLGSSIPASFYSKSLTFTPQTYMTDEGIDALFEYLHKTHKGTIIWFVIFDLEGGYINTIPKDEAAYVLRDTQYFLQTYAVDIGPVSDTTHNFLQGVNDVIANYTPGVGGAYSGYVDRYLPNGQQEYWQSNLPRLEQIKKQIDPNDVFHNPQSVAPASD